MQRGCGCRLLIVGVALIAAVAWCAFALNYNYMQTPQSSDEAFFVNMLRGAVMVTQLAAGFFGWQPPS